MYSPTAPTASKNKNIVNAIKELGHEMDTGSILKEFEWQRKGNSDIKDLVIAVTSPTVFAFNKAGSPFIQLVHSVGKFWGAFNPAEYQDKVIGFV